jgi:hypothetical protein
MPWHRTPMGCSLPHPLPLARRQRATEEYPHRTSPRRSLESGADDTEAMSAGRWGHLSRLAESLTRVEVTETTRCDATPRHHRRQTAQTVRTRAAHGQAPASVLVKGADRLMSVPPHRAMQRHTFATIPTRGWVLKQQRRLDLTYAAADDTAGRRRIHERQVRLVGSRARLHTKHRGAVVAPPEAEARVPQVEVRVPRVGLRARRPQPPLTPLPRA